MHEARAIAEREAERLAIKEKTGAYLIYVVGHVKQKETPVEWNWMDPLR